MYTSTSIKMYTCIFKQKDIICLFLVSTIHCELFFMTVSLVFLYPATLDNEHSCSLNDRLNFEFLLQPQML